MKTDPNTNCTNYEQKGKVMDDEIVMTHEVHIRRATLVNDDPQRRCYNGCFFKSHMEFTEWKFWQDSPSEEAAKRTARIFSGGSYEYKVVESNDSCSRHLKERK